jgi:predicted ATPase/DNA-binding CsgD family transcriptional regulator
MTKDLGVTGQPVFPANVSEFPRPTRPLSTLPPQPTPLLGRDAEVAAVQARLADPGLRLLTLTGPGGTGKTRLAVAAAAGMVDYFAEGVVFVDLAPVRDAGRAPAAIAQAMDASRTVAGSDLAALIAATQRQQVLLVLDNFEQVLAAAVDIGELVAACPGVTVLVTSRAPLRVRWEQEYPVAPLALPGPHLTADLAALSATPAVALFLERTRAVRPDFTLTSDNAREVAAICTHLDGLPLAIELAAARMRILPPRALRARLSDGPGAAALQLLSGGARDLPERQRSLRDTIAWSYDLLPQREQTLFRRLAVFAGGWTAAAAEAVCGGTSGDRETDLPAGAVMDGLASLVEHSLMVQQEGPGGEPRFGMLETIHQFSREQLVASGEEQALHRRHALYLLHYAQTGGRALAGSQQSEWVQRLEADHHNLRSALAWALAAGEAELALQFCAALSRFWYVRGHYREGRVWSDRALTAAPHASPAIRAAVFEGAGSLADMQHDAVEARRLLDASVELWRTVGNGRRLAAALAMRGMLARHGNDPATARASCQEALTIRLEPSHRFGHRLALSVLGFIAEGEGDHATARRLLKESLQVARESTSPLEIALQLNNLGIVALRHGDDGEATGFYLEALRLSWDIAASEIIAGSLEGFAGVAAARRQPRRAAQLLGAAMALREEISGPPIAQFEEEYQRIVPRLREALGEVAYADATAAGAAVPLADIVALALADYDVTSDLPASVAGDDPHTPPVRAAGGTPPRATRWPVPPTALTERQLEYLRLLARGHTNREIAGALVVSEIAVERMLDRLYDKIHVRNRSEAIRYALDHDLDPPHAR